MKNYLGSVVAGAALIFGNAAFAGSLEDPVVRPPVVISAVPAPMISPSNFYASIQFGTSIPDEFEFTSPDGKFGPFSILQDLEDGAMYSGAVGYEFGNNFRLEGEILYFENGSGDQVIDAFGGPPDPTEGKFSVTAGMLNGWYSFGSGALRPFVGGGVGFAKVEADLANTSFNQNVVILGIEDSDTVPAWQAGVGAEYAFSEAVSVLATYRYLSAPGLEFTDIENDELNADYATRLASIGVMYRF